MVWDGVFSKMYDIVIIGGGPAAVSAGIYLARKKVKALLLTKDWGGQMAYAPVIQNYPGLNDITGMDLVNKFTEHLKKNELEIKEGMKVKEVKRISDSELEIKTENESYKTKTIIVATGRKARRLNVPGEEEFFGKGISYCATCDAPLFQDRTVAVIGGANAGLGTALELANYASKIYILETTPQLQADEFLQEKIKEIDKIEAVTNVKVAEIKGDKFVTALVYSNGTGGKDKELPVQGIFLAIGSMANSSFVKDVVELNESGEIKINGRNHTSQPNIFAAGDVTDVSHKQVIIAAGEGAKAALNAYDYLKKERINT